MTIVARIRHLSLVLVAVSALVAPVLAGERCAPCGTEDCQGKGRTSPSSYDAGTASSPSSARASRSTSINPVEEVYAPKSGKSATASSRPTEMSPTASAPPPAPSAPPARKHESANSISRAPRPNSPRVKVSMRNLPATPGMGTLLRVGVSAGREISWLDFKVPSAPSTSHSGRAPPGSSAIAHPAPAALPGAPPQAANRARAQTSAAPPSFASPRTTPIETNPPGRSPRDFRACADGLATRPVSRMQSPFPHVGSGAERSESTLASDPPRLSGGSVS